ncbi:MAG TPA: serine/threonine-protein kinase, partial [Terracidiphilus sp.]
MRTGAMLFPVDPSADSHDLSKRSMKTCPVCDTPYPDQHNTCPTDGALLLETRELEPGQTVRGKYRIVRKLGQGGMGTVYLAEHQMLGGQVALKFLSSALSRDPQFVKRFRNEARAAYLLRHSNIVEVTDLDQDEDGSLFLAMEYVPGPSLRHAMKELKGPIATARAVEIVRGVAAGLAAAHARATVHRDIKPENILLYVGPDGAVQPKVLDFGIAALTENLTGYSQTHGLLLTPEYAAPEQWRGTAASELDGRTDLYALGGVMYEMLAGHKAFYAVNAEGWMYQHLQGVPTPLVQCRPEIEREWPGLAGITMRLLEKERERRFSSAEELLGALDQRPKAAAQPPQPAAPARIAPPLSTALPLQSTVQPMSQAQAPALAPGPRFITAADSSDDKPQSPRSSWKWTVLAASVAVVLGLILIYRQVRPATAAPEITTTEDAASGLRTVVLSDA